MADRLSQSENTTKHNFFLKRDFLEPQTWDGKFGCPLCRFCGENNGDLKKHYQGEGHRVKYFDAVRTPDISSGAYERIDSETEDEYRSRMQILCTFGVLPSYVKVHVEHGSSWFSNAFSPEYSVSLRNRAKRGETYLLKPQDFAHSLGNNLGHSFFCVKETGKRSRKFASYPDLETFWRIYEKILPQDKTFQEQFLEGQHTKEIWDLETTEWKEGEVDEKEIFHLFQKARREFSPEEKLDFVVLTSSGKDGDAFKFSLHVVVSKMWYDLSSMAGFCGEFCCFLSERNEYAVLEKLVDKGIYTRNRTVRMMGSVKFGSERRLVPLFPAEYSEFFCTAHENRWIEITPDNKEEEGEAKERELPEDCTDVELALDTFVEEKCRGAFDIVRQGNFWRLQRFEGIPNECVVCNREHDGDNAFAYLAGNRLMFGCYREEKKKYEICRIQSIEPSKRTPKRKGICKIPEETDLPRFRTDFRYNSEFTRPFVFPEGKDTLFLMGGMGTAKTKELASYLLRNSKASVLVITYRVSLARELSLKFSGFVSYEDSVGKIREKRLVCQVDSLWRVRGKFDIVVCDEATYTLGHMLSFPKNKKECWDAFKYYVRKAEKCIFVDKNMNQSCVDAMESLGRKVYSIKNEHKAHEGKKCLVTFDIFKLKKSLFSDLENGLKIGLASNSKRRLLLICKEAEMRGFKVLWYTGDGRSEKVWLESWKNYDLVAYSPTISAGVSYEEQHFDKVYGVCCSWSCNGEEFEQMLFRIRDVKQKEIVLYFDERGSKAPITRKEVALVLERKEKCSFSLEGVKFDRASGKLRDNVYNRLYVDTMVQNNLSKRRISAVVLNLLEGQGVDISELEIELNPFEMREMRENIKELSEDIKQEEVIGISEAEDISKEEFSFLCSVKEKTTEEIFSCKKFMLSYNLEVPQEEICQGFVETYKDQQKQFQNQKTVWFGGTREETKERLKLMIKEKNIQKREMGTVERLSDSKRLEKLVYAERLFACLGFRHPAEGKKIDPETMKRRLGRISERVSKNGDYEVLFGKFPRGDKSMFWLNSIFRKMFGFGVERTSRSQRFGWEVVFTSPWLHKGAIPKHKKKFVDGMTIPKIS
nr:putative origin of replication binding protein [Marseillevirus futianmevirus]